MNRRKFTPEFKFKVVLEALSERYSNQELGKKYELHPGQIIRWKNRFLMNGQAVFDRTSKDAKSERKENEERLFHTIDQLKLENDFSKKVSS